ncbi:MAG: hypothetical protein V9G23_02990 [Giesbergeria sp.]
MLRSILLIALAVSSIHAADPAPPEGFRALFNGKDLNGWYGLNPHSVVKLKDEKKDRSAARRCAMNSPQHWKVENGELVNDGTARMPPLKRSSATSSS